EPRLQGVPGHKSLPQADMKDLRQSQEALLSSYGWVDQQAGIARIPIERAKELLLQKGLPSRQEDQKTVKDSGAAGNTKALRNSNAPSKEPEPKSR
ncbi:MAG TPA: hypothetical protein VFV34_07390, partial [Blastocatellia bacterium]|nr:hypothetical protein [Blastocatellia bacterium]